MVLGKEYHLTLAQQEFLMRAAFAPGPEYPNIQPNRNLLSEVEYEQLLEKGILEVNGHWFISDTHGDFADELALRLARRCRQEAMYFDKILDVFYFGGIETILARRCEKGWEHPNVEYLQTIRTKRIRALCIPRYAEACALFNQETSIVLTMERELPRVALFTVAYPDVRVAYSDPHHSF